MMIKDYNPTSVKELDFEDPHGNKGYNVFFENDDKPVFMMAKRAPEVGNVEYGQIIDTPKKSGEGTYRKFVRKQKEDVQQETTVASTAVQSTNVKFVDRDDAITRQSALKSAVAAVGKPEPDQILSLADDFLAWLRNDSSPAQVVEDKEDVPLPEPQGEVITINESEVSLDDIPF